MTYCIVVAPTPNWLPAEQSRLPWTARLELAAASQMKGARVQPEKEGKLSTLATAVAPVSDARRAP